MPRWTTARAVSRGADLRLRRVYPTFSPVKESTGREVRSDRTESGRKGLREELGLNVEPSLGFWRDEGPKIEDEKYEIDGDIAVVAIFNR